MHWLKNILLFIYPYLSFLPFFYFVILLSLRLAENVIPKLNILLKWFSCLSELYAFSINLSLLPIFFRLLNLFLILSFSEWKKKKSILESSFISIFDILTVEKKNEEKLSFSRWKMEIESKWNKEYLVNT